MEIRSSASGDRLEMKLIGRLDTSTAPQLESALNASLDGVHEFSMDFEELEYISSAGLRVLLSTQKRMNRQGTMKVRHVNATIMEVFEITGFCDILAIE